MSDRATQIEQTSVDDALADPAFAAFRAGGPIFVAAGDPPRPVYASEAALALFRAADLDALAARCFAGDEPGARRLTELASTLPPGGPARMERLRFFIDGDSIALIFVCRRAAGPAGLFVAGAMNVRPALLKPQPPRAADEAQPTLPALAAPAAAPVAAPPALQPLVGSVRFLWQTDAAHRFTKINGALCDTLGYESTALIGASFFDLAARPGVDPLGRLREALTRRETWSGVEVHWPFANAPEAAAVTLGALPTFDRARTFTGFSGFGVIHLNRVTPLAAAPEPEPAPEEPAPVLLSDDLAADRAEAESETTAEDAPAEDADLAKSPAPAIDEPAPVEPARSPYRAANVVALNAWKTGAATPAREEPQPEPPAPDEDAPAAFESEAPEDDSIQLSASERTAFREIARALGARVEDRPERDQRPAAQASAPAAAADASLRPAPAALVAPDAVASLVDRIELALIVCRGGVAVYINKAVADLLGYADPADFEAAGGLSRMFRGRALDSVGGDGAMAVVTRAGDVLPMEARITAIDWDGGPATLVALRPSNEGEHAAAVRSLESDVARRQDDVRELRAILDTATDGVLVLDDEGRILTLNASAEALFGYEQNEVAGESFTHLFARESHAAARDYLSGLKTNGVRSVLNDGREVTGRARQGGQMPMFMTLGRIGEGDAAKFCAVLRDLTQWKNAERELKDARREAERASALKSDFLAKISHEVRTPLNAILGFAEVMMDERFGSLGNERYKDYLKDIHSSGTHVMSLVNDLLDLSKIEAGKLDLSFGSVDANKIVGECVSIMQPQAIRERVILRLSLAPRLPNIVADERSLRQIVLNILSNAVKFNQPGGQVIVSTALTDSGGAVLRVRDTGIGMSDREVETALEPFRQIQTSRQTKGTGLGLPLTKALVEANRAAFTIQSRKGEGTLVEVAFPPTRVLAE
ncbi:MAG: sensor histidine kinase [Hyphomicrobiales bacterium]|nr:sensor histidine kinase [Hyphomicrobiales bacterium]